MLTGMRNCRRELPNWAEFIAMDIVVVNMGRRHAFEEDE